MTILALVALLVSGGQQLLDRTLALVSGQPITLSDVRGAVALGLIEGRPGDEAVPAATDRLVDRALILREVQRYAPPMPAESAVDARLAEIRDRVGPAEWMRALERFALTEARLRAWVRDDLRAQAYLAQRFASASTPTDGEVAAAYNRGRAEFERQGITFEQAMPALRERLAESRRAELTADWLADLRRRTDIVRIPQ